MDAQLLHQTPARPRQMPRSPAPSRGAPHYARAAWAEEYVAWYISQTPQEGPLPPDISPTHRFEIEFAYCMLDPQRYQRETQEELSRPAFRLPE